MSYSMRTALRTRLAMSAHTRKPLLLLKLRDGCDVEHPSLAGVDFGRNLFRGSDGGEKGCSNRAST